MFTSILLKCDSKQYRQFNSHQSPNWFVHKLTNHPTIRHLKAQTLQSFRAVSFSRRWVSDGFDQCVAIVNQTGTYQGVIDNGLESKETAGTTWTTLCICRAWNFMMSIWSNRASWARFDRGNAPGSSVTWVDKCVQFESWRSRAWPIDWLLNYWQ